MNFPLPFFLPYLFFLFLSFLPLLVYSYFFFFFSFLIFPLLSFFSFPPFLLLGKHKWSKTIFFTSTLFFKKKKKETSFPTQTKLLEANERLACLEMVAHRAIGGTSCVSSFGIWFVWSQLRLHFDSASDSLYFDRTRPVDDRLWPLKHRWSSDGGFASGSDLWYRFGGLVWVLLWFLVVIKRMSLRWWSMVALGLGGVET